MITIIAGTRTITDHHALLRAIKNCGWDITGVVCGGARGVDAMGKTWALVHNVPVTLVLPDWNAHGRAAGPIRNAEMAKVADALILLWDGHSRGSASMLREAKARGLRIHECIVGGNTDA